MKNKPYAEHLRKPIAVLIIGITGRSGGYLLDRIVADERSRDFRFVAVVRESSDTRKLDACGFVEKRTGDIYDRAFMEKALIGVDVILNIAGIHNTLNLMEMARDNGVGRLICVHTTGIFSRYKAFSRYYREVEDEAARRVGGGWPEVTILRPTMIYGSMNDGNISTFVKMADRLHVFPVVSGGTFALQPVHQRDLGNAYFDVLLHLEETKNKAYNLSGAYPMDLIDILREIGKNLGKRMRFISVPFWLAYGGAVCLYGLSFHKLDYRERVQRLVEPRAFDHSDATRDFGYSSMGFREGIKAEVQEYLRQRKTKVS